MAHETWDAVDRYFGGLFGLNDAALAGALSASAAAGLPAIAVSAPQGRLLTLLAQTQGARRILEIGTLGGYSAICFARALPADGKLISLEYSPHHAEVARKNVANAGLADRVEIRVGAALESLAKLATEGPAPFDIVFIDADKENNPGYIDWALKLTRTGSLIIVDNVVRDGKVLDGSAGASAQIRGVRAGNERLAKEQRLVVTALQTVGEKGYDGFAIARVTREA